MAQVVLNDVLIKQASNGIIAMVKEAHKTGGYLAIRKKLEEKEAGLSSHIYAFATTASKMGKGKMPIVAEYFGAMCKAAETHLKAVAQEQLGHPIEAVKDEIPCWPVFKSNILRAIKAGLDPANFDTLYKLTAARKAKEEAAGRNARPEGNSNREGGEGEGTEGGQGTGTGTGTGKVQVTQTLQAVLGVMQKRISGMTDEQQDTFAERLGELLNEFAEAAPEAGEKLDDAAEEAAERKTA